MSRVISECVNSPGVALGFVECLMLTFGVLGWAVEERGPGRSGLSQGCCHPWGGVTLGMVPPLGWQHLSANVTFGLVSPQGRCHPRAGVTQGQCRSRANVTLGMVSPLGRVWLSPLTPGSCSWRPSGAAAALGQCWCSVSGGSDAINLQKGQAAIKTTGLGQGMIHLNRDIKNQQPCLAWLESCGDILEPFHPSTEALNAFKASGSV